LRTTVYLCLAILFGCVSINDTIESEAPLLIVTGFPVAAERTDYFLDDCCENCLCHGLDVLSLSISKVETIHGSNQNRELQVAMLDGFTWTDRRDTGRHLFVLRRLTGDISEKGKLRYTVVEGDPVDAGQACTSQRLEDYVSGEADFFSYGAWEEAGEHCYSIKDLERHLAGDT